MSNQPMSDFDAEMETFHAPAHPESVVLRLYTERLERAVPTVLGRVSGMVSNITKAHVHVGLELFSALPSTARRRTLGHPHFCYWWATLREQLRSRDKSAVEMWLRHLHRLFVPAALTSGVTGGWHLELRTEEGMLRFPGLPGWLDFKEAPAIEVHARLAEPGTISLAGGSTLNISELTGSDRDDRLVLRPTIGGGYVEIDASDPWLVRLFQSLNCKPPPPNSPPRDLEPFQPVPFTVVKSLRQALDLIRRVNAQYHDEFISHTHLIVPYRSQTYSTFTEMSFAGSVFMSEAHRPFSSVLDTAEHLLHEHSHYRFALMLEHDEFVVDEGRSYYSVWRRQDRDLNGMLQAIFVFARIAHFLRLGIEQGMEGAWSQRRDEVIRDLKAGLRDLTAAAPPRFTPIGRRLFDHIQEEVAR